jgi:hypothetical protein
MLMSKNFHIIGYNFVENVREESPRQRERVLKTIEKCWGRAAKLIMMLCHASHHLFVVADIEKHCIVVYDSFAL